MEDQSMLCMFEGDTTSFLEELTGPVPSVNSMGSGEGPGMMQAQDQQGMGPGMGGGMQGMGHMQQQQQQPGWGQQGQKLHHYDYNQQNLGAQGMMSPGSQGFGSPPLQSPQPGGGFNYQSMQQQQQQQQQQPHQQITPPRQQTPQPHGPQGMWNQSPGSQASSMSNSPYGNMQQPGSFSGHHDYALPANQAPNTPPHPGPRLSHYQQTGGPQSGNYQAPPHMGSPPPNPHMQQMHRGVTVQYGMQSANVIPMHQGGQMQNIPGGYMTQRQQMPMSSSGNQQINGGQMHYAYSQQSMMSQQQSMPHYQQGGAQQQQQYHYRGGVPGMPSSSQGNYTSQSQQSAQQPQHIMPRPPSGGSMGPNTQPMMRPGIGPMSQPQMAQGMQQQPPAPSRGYMNAQSMMNSPGGVVTSTTHMQVSGGQPQPVQSAAALSQQQQQLSVEINQLQQQINQLYGMPQTPQTQQKMLDVQERMRTLKAQQQQLLMQQQRQQQYPPQMGQVQGQMQQGAGAIKVQQIQVQQPGQLPKTIIIQQPQQGQQPQQQFIIRQQQQPQQNAIQLQASVGSTQQVPTSQSSTVLILPSTITTTPSTLPHPSTQLLNSSPALRSNTDHDDFLSAPPLQLQVPDQNGTATSSSGGMVMVQKSLLKSNVDELKDELNTPTTSPLSAQNDEDGVSSGQQEKANRIIQEAIAKAQAEGRPVPAVVTPDMEGDEPLTEDGKKKKKAAPKRERKKKEPKEPKEPKPKKPKKVKEPKDGESPPKKKKASPKKKKKKAGEEEDGEGEAGLEGAEGEVLGDNAGAEGEEGTEVKEIKKKTPARPRPKKKRTIPTFLKNKKRKRKHSSDDEVRIGTPPPSPPEEESGIQKRRSARNTKRKKYLDDLDLDLSEDEDKKGPVPMASLDASLLATGEDSNTVISTQESIVAKPVAFFVENPAEEDAQIVEKILGVRTVKRKMVTQKIQPQAEGEEAVVDVEGEGAQQSQQADKPVLADASEGQEDMETDGQKEGQSEQEVPQVEAGSQEAKPKEMDESVQLETKPVEVESKTNEGQETEEKKEKSVTIAETPPEDVVEEEIEEEEFFVKYKNFSYLHCEWRTAEELERGDRRIHQKIKRYKQKRAQAPAFFLDIDEDELFNPAYVEVDRILDVSKTTDPVSGDELTHYLVKWRGLPYEDSTWELSLDVEKAKIQAFEKFNTPPNEEEIEVISRPAASKFTKLEESPVYKNGNHLREYQLEGVSWLLFSWYNKQNCILADEMGLGKTIQSITFLQHVYDYGIHGPFLVIVPLSTIGNWQREFDMWTDMNVIVYHGSSASRNMLQEFEMYFKDSKGKRMQDVYKFHALITTYETIISDVEELSQVEWRVVVIDEAHRLKNRNCKLLEGLRCFDLEHRVLLTGTPLQNNVDELFSLLNFLEPKQFSSSESFLKEFGDLKTDTQVDKLKALLRPMMLRRLKEDVEKNLAPKEETIIEVELTNIQKKYYRAILEKNFSFLAKGTTSNNVPNLMNTMMELRKCCNHPYLVNGAEEQILEETRIGSGVKTVAELPLEKHFQAMVQASGKLVLIDKLLPRLKEGDHKVLIFSQMIRVLDIIEDYLIQKHYLYERIDGRIRGDMRQEAIDRFSKAESDRFVFLLCTRAGGLGINLTAADTVIIYDSDWNPQNDLQAQARCHRIGQEKAVKVYRLVTRNTYEREMFDKASLKLGLDKAVLQSMGTKEITNSNQLSKNEIEDLLKKGAYGALMEDDSAGDQFCEENIDDILERRTQVIQIEAGEKGSTFSKASFNVTGTSDIDLDDPNFWQKWAKKADIEVDDGRNELIMEMPRQRKQTARYGNQDMMENMSELDSSDSDDDSRGLGRGRGKTPGGKSGRRGRRRRDEDSELEDGPVEFYTRSECFKVEKNLLIYGYGRWSDILLHGRFKRKLTDVDVETITRALLLYSLRNYAGDERIKQFIYDLVVPSQDGQEKDYKNHLGLSAPVPRGRKGKKNKKETSPKYTAFEEELSKLDFDPEAILLDEGYKKHLKRHANKVLLRVRLLYYLKQEVIGNQAEKVFGEAPVTDIDIPEPCVDGDPPAFWWDRDADKSLLIGTFKHGYEKYNSMRQDPALCFLSRCGPPDSRALAAEQNDMDDTMKDDDDDAEATPSRGRGRGRKKRPLAEDEEDTMDSDMPGTPSSMTPGRPKPNMDMMQVGENGKLPFPLSSDLNTRLRRVITGYQRNHKREQLKQEQNAKRMERRERFEAVIKERERQRLEAQQAKWSRREEADFYRVVSTFGIERNRKTGEFIWDTFRSLAKLDRKYGDTITEYFLAFYHMCMRVCRRFKSEQEAIPPNPIPVEPITEERASRCLARIELLNKIREVILWHPKLNERLRMCQASPDLPEWWIPGEHDKELLIGAAKHGLARTDYHILYDPKLTFRELVKNRLTMFQNQGTTDSPTSPGTPSTQDMPDIVNSKPEPVIPKPDSKLDNEKPPKLTRAEEIEDMDTQEGALNLCKKEIKVSGEEMEIKEESEDKDKESIIKENEKSEISNEGSEVKEEKGDTPEVKDMAQVKEESATEDTKAEEKIEEESESKKEVKADDEMLEKKDPEIKKENVEATDTSSQVETGEDTEEEPPLPLPNLTRESRPVDSPSLDDEQGYPSDMGLDFGGTGLMAQAWNHPAVQWPKDRVIAARLESVCHCIEKGEWPQQRQQRGDAGSDSRSSTPVSHKPSTPLPSSHDYMISSLGSEGLVSSHPASSSSSALWRLQRCTTGSDDDTSPTPTPSFHSHPYSNPRDFQVQLSEVDGLKMTFQKRRKRRTKAEIEADRVARLREMMGANLSEAESESNLSSAQQSEIGEGLGLRDCSPLPSRLRMQAADDDSGMSGAERKDSDYLERKRHRQKRKIDKLLEAAEAAAKASSSSVGATPTSGMATPTSMLGLTPSSSTSSMAALAQAMAVHQKQATAQLDPDMRVPVIRLTDGARLVGEDAPKYKNLGQWLEEHPHYTVDRGFSEDEVQNELEQALGQRRGRRRRVDPSKLDFKDITGEENVAVINRETGKRITGAKAPPLRYLKEWLLRNPGFDVDPKWAHVVQARGNLPEELKSRILIPQGRGRRPASMLTPSSSATSTAASSAALLASDYYSSSSLASLSAMANYQKMAALGMSPYSSLTSAMTNPMYANLLASYGLVPGISMPKGDEDGEREEGEVERPKKKGEEDESSPSKSPAHSSAAAAAAAAAAALHPSFSYMYGYNPMLLNQLYAQSLAAANFSLPTSMASSFASLAQQAMPNGLGAESEEEEGPRSEAERDGPSTTPQDLSVRHKPQDLSMKSTSAAAGKPQDLSVKKHSRKSAPTINSTEPEDLSVKQRSAPQDLSIKKKAQPSASQGGPSPVKSDKTSPQKAGGNSRDVILRTPKVGKSGKSKLDSIVAAISAKAEAKQQQQDDGSSPEKSSKS